MSLCLMAISDRHTLKVPLLEWIESLGRAEVPLVQLREKDLDDRALFELATQARDRLPAGCRLLVNGRADIAVAAGADGVHLPADETDAGALKHRFPELLVGRSTHRPSEVRATREAGADYATFGPVFETPSKAAFGPPRGLEELAAATQSGLPVLALGGIGPQDFGLLAARGATGAAGIGMFRDLDRVASIVARAREAFG